MSKDLATQAIIDRVARDARDTPMKAGKTPFELVDLPFVGAIARQLGAGIHSGRTPDCWKQLDPYENLPLYRAAMLRHAAKSAELIGSTDDTGESHYAAIGANAMLCHYFESAIVSREGLPVEHAVANLSALWGLSPEDTKAAIIELADMLR